MQRDNPLVSIVVPAYNAQNYIRKCIDSVLAQTYKNIELVIVNDGSTDHTKAICDLYASIDERVHVIHKKNAGVSAARNSGISKAKGILVCFLDSDDWLSPDIIQKGVNKFRADFLNVCGTIEFLPNGLTKHECIIAQNLTREELVANAIYRIPDDKYSLGTYFRAVWGKLFEKKIIDEYNIRFPENLYMGEDAIFLINYLAHVSGINVVANDGYNYNRMNEGSATAKYHHDLYEQCEIQYGDILESITENVLNESVIISDSLVNFRWWMVTALIDNSVKGIKNNKIPIKDLMKQSVQWIEKYRIEMKKSMVNSSNIGKRHQRLYEHRKDINVIVLTKDYLLPQVVKKLFS